MRRSRWLAQVRIMLDRDEDMRTTGGRHAFYARYKVGATRAGKLQALKVELFSNMGNSLDLSMAVPRLGTAHSGHWLHSTRHSTAELSNARLHGAHSLVRHVLLPQ